MDDDKDSWVHDEFEKVKELENIYETHERMIETIQNKLESLENKVEKIAGILEIVNATLNNVTSIISNLQKDVNQLKMKSAQETPLPSSIKNESKPLSWGFKFLLLDKYKTTCYTSVNQSRITKAYLENKNNLSIWHTTEAGYDEGREVMHIIDFRTGKVLNTFNGNIYILIMNNKIYIK